MYLLLNLNHLLGNGITALRDSVVNSVQTIHVRVAVGARETFVRFGGHLSTPLRGIFITSLTDSMGPIVIWLSSA